MYKFYFSFSFPKIQLFLETAEPMALGNSLRLMPWD